MPHSPHPSPALTREVHALVAGCAMREADKPKCNIRSWSEPQDTWTRARERRMGWACCVGEVAREGFSEMNFLSRDLSEGKDRAMR